MNIVFVTQSIGFGGAAKMLTFVANELSNRGHRVSIINLSITATGVSQPVNEEITIYDVDSNRHGLKKLKCVNDIVEIAKKVNADVLIGFTIFPNAFVSLAAMRLGIPSIISERGDPYKLDIENKVIRLFLWLVNRSRGGVFQTEGAKEFYGKGLQKRGVVIPNPVILKEDMIPADYESCEKSIAYVARFEVKQKRQDVMLRAFALVHEKFPEYRLDFYGDGPDEPAMKKLTEELGLTNCVVFHGLSRTVHKELARSELFVLSSDYEGIPNALIEAMSVGLPCVSTDCSPGGARMLITHEENGLLVKCGDPEALAEGICRFLSDRDLAIRCAKNAVSVKERFLPEKIVNAWEDYCVDIAKGKRAK